MLAHYGQQSYAEASSKAAVHARTIMEEKIQQGLKNAESLITHLATNIPTDYLARPAELSFVADDYGMRIDVTKKDTLCREFRAHNNALSQVAARTHINYEYLRKLVYGFDNHVETVPPWQRDLAAHILDRHVQEVLPASRSNLIRTVSGRARAFLSDSYNIYDSSALLESFVEAAQALAVPPVPVAATCTDLRTSLKMFLPVVLEPIENEVMCYGVEWFNSDFGCGRYGVRVVLWRLFCTNFAMLEEGLFEVHLGPRLTNDRLIQFSQKTRDLHTQARIEATKDIVKSLMSPERVDGLMRVIRQAGETELDWAKAKGMLARLLHAGEMEEAEQLFESEDDIRVPKRQSLYKVSQILGLFAGQTTDLDRRLDLEKASGAVLLPLLKKAA